MNIHKNCNDLYYIGSHQIHVYDFGDLNEVPVIGDRKVVYPQGNNIQCIDTFGLSSQFRR